MKTIFTLALVLCLGTFASAQIPSYVPPNGLVGWWPFNGNANDESGNGNHGMVNGATLAADRFGNAGKAYSFDGVNDDIQVSNLSDTFNAFTISIWFNQTISGHLFDFGNEQLGCNNPFSNRIGINDFGAVGKLAFSLDCNYGQAIKASYFSNQSGWNYLTASWNGSVLKMFLNDTLISSNPSNVNEVRIFQNDIKKFGSRYQPLNNNQVNFGGLLDDIAIYNRALTAAEVQQLYLSNCTQPTFTSQPQNKSVGQGQTTTFAVQVDTTATFQWQMDNGFGFVNLVNSSLFSGVTTKTLTVKGSNSIDGYSFRCIATACQSDTSNAATLTVTSNSSTLGSLAGVPGKINYQGAAMDSLGKPMKNQTIALQLSVLDSSSTGAAAYVETHSTPTNGSGLFSLQIGGGTAVNGTFDSIPWANGRNKYLKTEVQQNGTRINLGTSQLVSVPYALVSGYSQNSGSAATLRDSLGNAYQIKTVNGQPTLVSAPGNVSSPGTFACGQAVNYAGESYPTVQIGSQCWFQKNVNAGTMVLGANDQTNNGNLEKYCYNNDPSKCGIFGGLYQWAEAVQYQNGASNTASPSPAFSGNVKGICPTGWHVPSDGEWCTLTTYLDSTVICLNGWTGTDVYLKMSSWTSPNSFNSNISGFSSIPGGHKNSTAFYNIGSNTFFWSTSEISSTTVLMIELANNFPDRGRTINPKSFGFSVRCLKD
jgi:uncharacterized protein (TIGR02145 family)